MCCCAFSGTTIWCERNVNVKFCSSTLWETRIPPEQMWRRPFSVSLSFYLSLLVYAWLVGQLRTSWPFICSEQRAMRSLWLPHGSAQVDLGTQEAQWMVPRHLVRMPWEFPSMSETDLILQPEVTEMGPYPEAPPWVPPGTCWPHSHCPDPQYPNSSPPFLSISYSFPSLRSIMHIKKVCCYKL